MNAPAVPTITFHPLAAIFPLIDGEDFDRLRDDIAAHGVREPVVLFEGAILDGRNRYRAAQAAGVDCPMTEYRGDDPAAYVVSLNLHRRHLTESQRAMAAAKLANMQHGGDRKRDQAESLPLEPRSAPVSQADAAGLLNVSDRSIRTARKVQSEAAPEIVRAVERGDLSVSLAAKAAGLPKQDQAEIIDKAPDKAALRRSVLAAVEARPRAPSNKNPHRTFDAVRDAIIVFTGRCRDLARTDGVSDLLAWDDHDWTVQEMGAQARAARDFLNDFIAQFEDRHADH